MISVVNYLHLRVLQKDALTLKGQVSLPVDHANEIRHSGKKRLLTLAERVLLIKCPSESLHKLSHTLVLLIITTLSLSH